MDWVKHKELYAEPNMSKLFLMAVNKWKDYRFDENKINHRKQAKLTLINCDDA